jgi:ubiquinone/menaquinone biosynthesis C-methylase UbiE
LTSQDWQVSALDVSEVALNRARAAARRACVDVEWIHASLLKASLGDRVFDLVSVQSPALLRTPSNTAEHALLASVARCTSERLQRRQEWWTAARFALRAGTVTVTYS